MFDCKIVVVLPRPVKIPELDFLECPLYKYVTLNREQKMYNLETVRDTEANEFWVAVYKLDPTVNAKSYLVEIRSHWHVDMARVEGSAVYATEAEAIAEHDAAVEDLNILGECMLLGKYLLLSLRF